MKQAFAMVWVIAGLVSGVAGCTREPAPTVEYYRANPQERQAQMQKCANDPGSLAETPACINAKQATELERTDTLRNLPAMGLSAEDPAKVDAPATSRP